MDTSEGATNIVMPTENEVEEKFHVFVKAYVSEFERKLQKYDTEAAVGWQGYEGIIATVVVASIAAFVPLYGNWLSECKSWLLFIGIVLPLVLKYSFAKRYREKTKKTTRIFHSVKKEDLRRMLVEAAGSIFYSFQSQFMVATDADGGWKRGLLKLAIDACDRSLSYINKEKYILLSVHLLTEGLTKGESKGTFLSCIFPRALQHIISETKPGHTIQLERRSENCKTSELYEKVAVKIVGKNNEAKYYKLHGTDCGFRNSFSWEDEDLLVKLNYEGCGPNELQDSRTYLTPEELETKNALVLEDINAKDPQLCLHRINKLVEELVTFQKEIIHVIAKQRDVDEMKKRMPSRLPAEDELIFNLMPPVKTFTGRRNELYKLYEKLQTNCKRSATDFQCVAISGLGGMGKSELARQYAWEYRESYKNRIWINSENKLAIIKLFQQLADRLEISRSYYKDSIEKYTISDIYERLAKDETLLIFDDVNKFKDIRNFLPPDPYSMYQKLAIIITSRNCDWDIVQPGKVHMIMLKEFTPDEASSFVKKSLPITNEDEDNYDDLIPELIKDLSYFPLALHLAVPCIKTKSSFSEGIQEYLMEFRGEEQKKNLLKWRPKHDLYTETMYTTWRVTFENIRKMEKNGDLAIRRVEVMSYLESDGIYIESTFNDFPIDGYMHAAWHILDNYSIITLRTSVVYIHRLVKDVVRLWLKDNKRENEVIVKSLTMLSGYLYDDKAALLKKKKDPL